MCHALRTFLWQATGRTKQTLRHVHRPAFERPTQGSKTNNKRAARRRNQHEHDADELQGATLTDYRDARVSAPDSVVRHRMKHARPARLQHVSRTPQTTLWEQNEVVSRVSRAIHRRFGRNYTVVPFGSAVYMCGVDGRVYEESSGDKGVGKPLERDLDLVVLDNSRPLGFTPDVDLRKLPAVYNIWRLAHVLENAGFTNVCPVPSSGVPIVKFHDPVTQTSLDINVNDRLGLMNSRLLRNYGDALPGLRALLATIKSWAQPLGLNQPSSSRGSTVTFSTYSLALMTLGWLQSRGLAPNLQDGFPGPARFIEHETFWVRRSSKDRKSPRQLCDTRFRSPTTRDYYPPLPLKETLKRWFQFWGHGFDFERNVIDIKGGGIRARQDVAVDEQQAPLDGAIHVVDPFLRSRNVTKNIGFDALELFCAECRAAVDDQRVVGIDTRRP